MFNKERKKGKKEGRKEERKKERKEEKKKERNCYRASMVAHALTPRQRQEDLMKTVRKCWEFSLNPKPKVI